MRQTIEQFNSVSTAMTTNLPYMDFSTKHLLEGKTLQETQKSVTMGVYHTSLVGSNCFLTALSFVTESTKYKLFVFKCSLVFQQYLHYPQRDNWIKTNVENSPALAKHRTDLEGVPQHSTGQRLSLWTTAFPLGARRTPSINLCVGNLEQQFATLLILVNILIIALLFGEILVCYSLTKQHFVQLNSLSFWEQNIQRRLAADMRQSHLLRPFEVEPKEILECVFARTNYSTHQWEILLRLWKNIMQRDIPSTAVLLNLPNALTL